MTTQLEQIKEQRQEAKDMIELAEHLGKLQKNRSFNKVINEYILKDLAVNAATVYGRPELNEMSAKSISNTLTMVSTLNETLSRINVKANEAEQLLVQLDEVELDLLNEEEGE